MDELINFWAWSGL